MKPLPHQLVKSEECWLLLKELGYVYLAGMPRSGKTLTAILTAEKSTVIKNVLVITKLKAIPGWHKFTQNRNLGLKHNYTVTNYEQVKKLSSDYYDLIIIDESHNLGTLGKPSLRIKTIKEKFYKLPHINLSGTAIVESPNGIYHQMALSVFTPFKHKNFYDFFREFGKPYYIKAGGREITQYDKCDLDKLLPIINSFTVYMTQEDAGISKEHQAVDKLHFVELNEQTKKLYNELQDHQIADVWENMFNVLGKPAISPTLVCDTTMKLRTSLHMLESGVAKVGDNYLDLGNNEKIDYILKTFGDTKDTGIMCHFIGEQIKLEKVFKNATIYSSTSHAEGVDLSHLTNFVILSSNYSGSKFIQRKDRIINTNGSNTTTVHHILVRKAVSEQVYDTVSKKEDFNNSTYVQERL